VTDFLAWGVTLVYGTALVCWVLVALAQMWWHDRKQKRRTKEKF